MRLPQCRLGVRVSYKGGAGSGLITGLRRSSKRHYYAKLSTGLERRIYDLTYVGYEGPPLVETAYLARGIMLNRCRPYAPYKRALIKLWSRHKYVRVEFAKGLLDPLWQMQAEDGDFLVLFEAIRHAYVYHRLNF